MRIGADNRYHVNGIIDLGHDPERLSVLELPGRDYLAFRTVEQNRVYIGKAALHDLIRDMSREEEENMGFLLGNMRFGTPTFVRYETAEFASKREMSLSYSERLYLRQLRRFREEGFDVQADVHNHPYENLFLVDVESEMHGLPTARLLRHGLFSSLEAAAGFSKYDIRSSRSDHKKAREHHAFSKSLSGVFEMFRLEFNKARVMTLKFASGPNMATRHGVGVSELCE